MPAIRFNQRLEIDRLRLMGEVVLVQGKGPSKLYAWTGAWYTAFWQANGPLGPCLEIQSLTGEPLLSWGTQDLSPFIQQLLAGAYPLIQGGAGPSAPRTRGPLNQTGLLLTHWHGLAEGWLDPADLAEAYGWLRLNPGYLQGHARTQLAEPELIPCLLESLVNQPVQVRLLTGSAGAVQIGECSLHAYRRLSDGWIRLSGEGVDLHLDPRQIDSAWVLDDPEGCPQLRLYEEGGRLILLMTERSTEDRPGPSIWYQLTRALLAA